MGIVKREREAGIEVSGRAFGEQEISRFQRKAFEAVAETGREYLPGVEAHRCDDQGQRKEAG
jgi:hypothetical protein